jgi:FixJ family two-component response regulator
MLHVSAVLNEPLTSPLERLSAREIQVLKLVVEGRTSKEVARLLGVLPTTIDTYRSRVMAKLDVSDLPALVRLAIRYRLIDL